MSWVTPRTFINCNLVNALPPPGSTAPGCNTTIVVRDNVASTDEIVIGAETITKDNLEDVIYGKTNPDTLLPEYKAVPERIPQ